MAMVTFFSRLPEIAVAETRTIRVGDHNLLPPGEYAFIEHYCDDPKCDCRRVLIHVWRPDTRDKVWAAINYGWESAEYYSKWSRGSDDDCQGPMLDPINPQSPYSGILLAYFKEMLKDKEYAGRFAKHYKMFRAASPNRKERRRK